MSATPIQHRELAASWHQPDRGTVGMASLILAETSMFTIFVVAYIYYMGTDRFGPTPRQVLDLPIFNTICLLGSSLTIWRAEHLIQQAALHSAAAAKTREVGPALLESPLVRSHLAQFTLWWGATILLGIVFLLGTAREWSRLIHEGLTIRTNLFGTTYYALVGLHATHVVVGLLLLTLVFILAVTRNIAPAHAQRIRTLALYWHFVDAVWVVVFTVVYLVGR